jgi:pimeloyl-ACP methyl ester carboxylesterase
MLAAVVAPGYEQALPTMAIPCLVYTGEADPVHPHAQGCVRQIPNATFVLFPGLDHMQTFLRSDLVLPHVTKFLAEVNQARV